MKRALSSSLKPSTRAAFLRACRFRCEVHWMVLPVARVEVGFAHAFAVAIGPNGAVYVTNWVEHVLSPRRSNRRGRARHGELSTLASGAGWSLRRPSPSLGGGATDRS